MNFNVVKNKDIKVFLENSALCFDSYKDCHIVLNSENKLILKEDGICYFILHYHKGNILQDFLSVIDYQAIVDYEIGLF